jgi:transposase InsO family protein
MMMNIVNNLTPNEKRAKFRFSVIGGLLSRNLSNGDLTKELQEIAKKSWRDPISGEEKKSSIRTYERWYYRAKKAINPIEALQPKVRSDCGKMKAINDEIASEISTQYEANREWSVELHHDNLEAKLKEAQGQTAYVPSYSTLLRYMREQGLARIGGNLENEAMIKALLGRQKREVVLFEAEYAGELYHTDAHHGKLRITKDDGTIFSPIAMAILDDHSRLGCHVQWYENEGAQELVHCTMQAFMRRGAPRKLMTDNGSAMRSAEMRRGCERLSVELHFNPAYSPWKNGKQESFWNALEGHLVAMAKKESQLTLHELNTYTAEWLEHKYNGKEHSETRKPPLSRFLSPRSVLRCDFSEETVRTAFMRNETRTVRVSDGTITLQGVRYQLPTAMRHLCRVRLRFAAWDKRIAYIEDERTGKIIGSANPVDPVQNSNSHRASLPNVRHYSALKSPVLRSLEKNRQESGRPPGYRPLD